MQDWRIYKGVGVPHDGIKRLPPPPPWRTFNGQVIERRLGKEEPSQIFHIDPKEIDMVNAALYLRRPLLITGRPGRGKSSLAKAVAYELNLGPVLQWSITTRSTVSDALYRYDAIARLHDASLTKQRIPDIDRGNRSMPYISRYLRLCH